MQARQNKISLAAMDPGSVALQNGGPCRLRVANLPEVGLTEDSVHDLFSPFGDVAAVEFERDGSGRFNGVAYVQYNTSPEGTKARQQLHGLDVLPGKPMQITSVPVPNAYSSAAHMAPGVAPGELDEGDEMGGLRMNASSRTALMARMSGAAGARSLTLLTTARVGGW